jgi:glutaredoxin
MCALFTIVAFTADGCPHCDALRNDLSSRNVRFLEINLSREPQRVEELRRHSWERRLPVVIDHEKVTIGFRGGSSAFDALGIDQID